MIFRKALTRKAAEVVEAVAEPAKKAVAEQIQATKDAVGQKSNLGANVVKFGLAVLMLLITFREDRNSDISVQDRMPALPSTITINNYVNDLRERSEEKQ